MVWYDKNQPTMDDTMNDNDNNQKMFTSNNPVSKVKNGSKTKNEAFAGMLPLWFTIGSFVYFNWTLIILS